MATNQLGELRPCPFCGVEAIGGSVMHKKDCYFAISRSHDAVASHLVIAWNTRPTEAAATAAERARGLALVYRYVKYRHAGQTITELIATIESGEQPEDVK